MKETLINQFNIKLTRAEMEEYDNHKMMVLEGYTPERKELAILIHEPVNKKLDQHFQKDQFWICKVYEGPVENRVILHPIDTTFKTFKNTYTLGTIIAANADITDLTGRSLSEGDLRNIKTAKYTPPKSSIEKKQKSKIPDFLLE